MFGPAGTPTTYTRVRLFLPFAKEACRDAIPADGCMDANFQGARVLLAEDEAVEVYQRHAHEIDICLLDMAMPRKDGAHAFAEIRRLCPDARIVLSSGYTEQDVTNRFKGAGAGWLHAKALSAPTVVGAVASADAASGARRRGSLRLTHGPTKSRGP